MSDVMDSMTRDMIVQLVLESAIRATALGVGVWGVSRVVKVRRAVHAWTMWIGVLAAAVLMPIAVVLTARAFASAPSDTTIVSLASRATAAATDLGIYGRVAGLAYLGVAGLLLLRIGIGVFALARVWRTATPVARLSDVGVRVRCSDAVATPVATGAGILLPVDYPGWSADTRTCVLTHEISHLVRKDFYWQLLAKVYAAVFWFNPFAWLLLRKIVLLAEHVSDDAAVAAIGRPVDYAAMLLQFAGRRPKTLLAVGMARPATVSLRIERILRGSPSTSVGRVERTVLAVCMVPALLLSTLSPQLRVLGRAGVASRAPALMRLTVPFQPLNTSRVAPLNTSRMVELNTSGMAEVTTSGMAELNTSGMAELAPPR